MRFKIIFYSRNLESSCFIINKAKTNLLIAIINFANVFSACKIEFHLQENFLLCVVLFCDLALTLRFTHQSSYNQETNLTIARAQRGFPTPLPHNHQWSEETKIIIQNSQSPVKVRTVRTFGLIAWIRKLLSWTQLFAWRMCIESTYYILYIAPLPQAS